MKRKPTALLLSLLLLAGLCAKAYADRSAKPLSFSTVTLGGEKISSRELFQDSKITVVNIWATWCGPCIEELDKLNELHARLQKQGCGVVGVLWDGDTALEEGRAIAEKEKLSYPNVLLSEDMVELQEITVFPTTLFVDSEGRPVAEAITGAETELVEETVKAQLKKMAAGAGSAVQAAGQSAGKGNTVKNRPVKTDNKPSGAPIPEGMKLICDGDACYLVPVTGPGHTDPQSTGETDLQPAGETDPQLAGETDPQPTGETDPQPTGETDPQPEPAENGPTCPILVVCISETEVHAWAAGEYAGMDGKAPYDGGNGGEK